MTKKVLSTRPRHDKATSYLHSFSQQTINALKEQRGVHVTDLEGRAANRQRFERALRKEAPTLLLLQGHGTRKSVCGHKDEVLLERQNATLARHAIVYALTCNSLASLGRNTGRAYIGYEQEFMLVTDPSRSTNPLKDQNAAPFKEATNVTLQQLTTGATVGATTTKTRDKYVELIRSIGTTEDDPYGDLPLVRLALAWNLEAFGHAGDENATF